MPAPFAASLGGYRADSGNPNTSDNGDDGSKELGRALFEEIGVPEGQEGPANPGSYLEQAIVDHLQPLRPDLTIRRSRSAIEFEQYAHLRVFPEFRKRHVGTARQIGHLRKLADALPPSATALKLQTALATTAAEFALQDEMSERLKSYMPEESLLKLDITCGSEREGMEPLLHLGLSSKWTLRTDRAQDCFSQGSKLASQRRGPMPHYAVITMEPRPAMLKILADGSGAVDYVYHVDLPALTRAIEKIRSGKKGVWNPGVTFERLLNQGRIRDYDDLVWAVQSIPVGVRSPVPEGAANALAHNVEIGPVDLTLF
jgi:hypothetical protein